MPLHGHPQRRARSKHLPLPDRSHGIKEGQLTERRLGEALLDPHLTESRRIRGRERPAIGFYHEAG